MEVPMNRLCSALAAMLLTLLVSSAAVAQVPPLANIWVSNSADDWSGAQGTFDPMYETTLYIQFTARLSSRLAFEGQCVFALAATRSELARVDINRHLRAGQDMLRTDPFVITWPAAPVEVTCVPTHAPAHALSVVVDAHLGQPPAVVYDPHAVPTRVVTTPGGSVTTGPGGVVITTPGVAVHGGVPPKGPGTVYVPVPVPVAEPGYVPDPVYVHEPVYVEAEPVYEPPPDCRSTLLALGHSASSLMFCDDDVNQACAVALLEAGHDPSSLIFCDDIADEGCAVQLLLSGGQPSEIIFCE